MKINDLRKYLDTAALRTLFDALCRLPLAHQLEDEGRADQLGRGQAPRADTSTLLWFSTQLEHVMAEVEGEEFPELRMANGEIIPIDTSIPDGAETFVYYLFSATGIAQFSAAYANGELPLVTLKGAKVVGNIEPMTNGYAYETREIRNAQFTGFGLETELSVAARRAHDQLLNDTGMWGQPDLGLPGLINHPNISVLDAADNGSGSTFMIDKNVDQILADFANLIHTPQRVSFNMHRVNRVEMPLDIMLLITTLRLGSGDGTLFVMDLLKKAHPNVTFAVTNELAASQSDGHLTEDAIIAYVGGDKRKVSLIQPMPFKQYPVQQVDLTFKVPCESSTGGVKLKAPSSVARMDGVGQT